MRDIFPEIIEWSENDVKFAIATVVNTWRSSPRPVGSSLIISDSGQMAGSVSGGCVEKSVVQKALRNMKDGSRELAKYGVNNEEAWEVGLSCGGKIDVMIEPFLTFEGRATDVWEKFRNAIENNIGAVLINTFGTGLDKPALYLEDGTVMGELSDQLLAEVRNAYTQGVSQAVEIGDDSYFLHVFPPKNKMLIIGSAHITTELIELANLYDFETVVIDPRDTFASKTTYRVQPNQIEVKWPQEILPELTLDRYTYAVILSHDPKIDDEALVILLENDVTYIGALGSKRTHEKRLARLKERGISDEQLARIHAPIGLDINAQIPKEIALSVMAEVIAAKNKLA